MRIGIIGHFGGNKIYHDGQTVKTMTIYHALLRHSPQMTINRVDTYYILRNPLLFCIQFFCCICRCKKIVVLLSKKGRTILFPILYLLCKAGKEVYHDSIGGQLAKEAERSIWYRKYISAFTSNWVESRYIAECLQKLGIQNALYIPNFKRLPVPPIEQLSREYAEPYRFVMFSRIMPEKGIGDAIRAIKAVNRQAGKIVALLDIYGPIENQYQQQLEQELETANDCCFYCGVVSANESVYVLKDYYALLFPTHWKLEGLPGTIIDAYCAGLPVIARRWTFCDEVVSDHRTGLVYDFEQPELLEECIRYAMEHSKEFIEMKAECLKAAKAYTEEFVMKRILNEMGIGSER